MHGRITAERFDGGDLFAHHGRYRHVARLHRFAVDNDGAGAALCQSAAVTGADQSEVIAQGVEQRRFRIGLHFARFAVYMYRQGHINLPIKTNGYK